MKTNEFELLGDATTFVASAIQNTLSKDILEKGEASLILTGGTTIRPFLKVLTTIDISWQKVWVFLSDERWVPITDDRSNEKQLREFFLNHLKVKPRFVSLKTNHETPAEGSVHLESHLQDVALPITCALLSVGEDGHVASLFPDEVSAWMQDTKSLFVTSQRGGRVSLGLPLLRQIKHPVFLSKENRVMNKDIQLAMSKSSLTQLMIK